MTNSRFTFSTEDGGEILVIVGGKANKITELSIEQLKQLEHDVHVQLLEKDASYQDWLEDDDRNIADD